MLNIFPHLIQQASDRCFMSKEHIFMHNQYHLQVNTEKVKFIKNSSSTEADYGNKRKTKAASRTPTMTILEESSYNSMVKMRDHQLMCHRH